MIDSNFIKEYCFTKTGKFNNRVAMKSWWINRGFSNEIQWLTEFMNDNGVESITEALYRVYHDMMNGHKCPVCENSTQFLRFKDGYRTYCSINCATSCPDRNRRISENKDYDEIIEKVKNTNLNKYGTESYFQTKEFKVKSKNSKLKKYGDPLYCNRTKIEKTNLEKYGSTHYFTSEIGLKELDKKRDLRGGSFKVSPESLRLLNNKDYIFTLNERMNIVDIADKIGVTPKTLTDRYGNVFKKHPTKFGKLQGELLEYLRGVYDGEILYNDRTVLSPKELDIFIPEKSLAIELNGVYWHSVETSQLDKSHLEKNQMCDELGIQLVQITDLEYVSRKDLIHSFLKSKLGMFEKRIRASDCDVEYVPKRTAIDFLNENHIQGYSGSNVNLGLYKDGELIYILSMGKPRFTNGEWEIIRLCSKQNYCVYGGASKLLKTFEQDFNPNKIISYSNIDKFDGKVYSKLGFKLDNVSLPNYVYYKAGKTISRYSAQKHKLKNLLENFDPSKSEKLNMLENGYRIYYDCGNRKYVKEITWK